MNDNNRRDSLQKLRDRENQYCPSRTYFQSDNKVHFTEFNSIEQTQLTNIYEEVISKHKGKPMHLNNSLQTFKPHDKFSMAYYLNQPIDSTITRNEKIDMISQMDCSRKNYQHLKDPVFDPIKLPYIDFTKKKLTYKSILDHQKIDKMQLLSPQLTKLPNNRLNIPKFNLCSAHIIRNTLQKAKQPIII
ncbi:hypothetical protein SS50377_28132 [Spironucleus salmonicida]|uniref:Uncharacterized protein n=1 Tax=Spironucleus salmonicida TaxID=348837 RepID=V6LGJ8_9EUKA|nr:hypothetical protein SS50377_28132 [Spironucleus salmonicida]|eukprot:EST42816.1 Hypothetical protein SS50377_17585 [Spironucleus salmonicida]